MDDAIGEAFDKTAKLLGLPYPGGPQVEREVCRRAARGRVEGSGPKDDGGDRIRHVRLAQAPRQVTGVPAFGGSKRGVVGVPLPERLTGQDVHGDGRRDGAESGLAGWTVDLLDGAHSVVSTAKTGSDGSFAFTGVLNGKVKWRVSAAFLCSA